MKTTRILVPAMVLTAGALLTAQETPGQPPERKPEPPTPAPADTQPAPADTKPAPAPAAPTDNTPAAPAPADTKPPVTPATPVAPAEAFPTPADVKPLPPTAPATPAPPAPTTQPGAPAPATPGTPAPQPISPVKPIVELPAVPVTPAPAPATPGSLVPKPPTVVQPAPNVPAAPAAQPNEPNLKHPRQPQFIGGGTINGTRVSARGRATIFSSLVFQFHKNEVVNILEEITIAAPKAGEPRKWYRVQMPEDAGVYVHGQFLSPTFNKTIVDANGLQITQQFATVQANLLNVRSNAGENFPIVCKLLQDTAVRVSGKKKGKWVEIFAPQNASVFVAAQFVTPAPLNNGVVAIPQPQAGVQPQPDGTVPAPGGATTPGVLPLPPAQPGAQPADAVVKVPITELTKPNGTSEGGVPIQRNPGAGEGVKPTEAAKPAEPVKPSETVETVKPAEPVKPAEEPGKPTEVAQPVKPEETVKPGEGTNPTETVKPAEQPEKPQVTEANPNLPPASTEKPGETPKTLRIVTREGVLKKNLLAPQAPSAYVLKHVETGKVINYLVLNHPVLKLNWYEGSKVLVTGEEAMDARNKKTPVLKIVTIKGEVNKAVLEEIAEAKARPVKPTEPVAAKPEAETPQPEAKPESQPEPAPEAKPEAQPEETQPDEKPEPQPEGEPKEEKEAPTN